MTTEEERAAQRVLEDIRRVRDRLVPVATVHQLAVARLHGVLAQVDAGIQRHGPHEVFLETARVVRDAAILLVLPQAEAHALVQHAVDLMRAATPATPHEETEP